MTIALSKTQAEIDQMPLVELAWEILRTKREPLYFRDLMAEIQGLRSMTDAQVMDVIAQLYTEINIDGRFLCIGQNVWGLKRWYPVDKVAEKSSTAKRFVRRTGDAFSDDDIDLEDDDFSDELAIEDDLDDPAYGEDDETDEAAGESEEDFVVVDEEGNFADEDEEDTEMADDEPFADEDADDEEPDEEDNY